MDNRLIFEYIGRAFEICEIFPMSLDHIYDELSIFEPLLGTFLAFVGIILLLVGNNPINTDKVLSWADTDNEKYHLFLHFRLVYELSAYDKRQRNGLHRCW